jgi:hypothetical protein
VAISVPTSQLQADAVTAAASAASSSVGDYCRDVLFTAANNRLGLGLAGAVAQERALVADGTYTACGSTVVISAGTEFEVTLTCVRIANHEQDALVAVGTHAGLDRSGSLTSWDAEI